MPLSKALHDFKFIQSPDPCAYHHFQSVLFGILGPQRWGQHAPPKCQHYITSQRFESSPTLPSGPQISQCNVLFHLLAPWCRVLLKKLSGLQLVKKFPAIHGTRRFITALTSVRHLSLSWASPYTHIPPPGDPSWYYPPIYT